MAVVDEMHLVPKEVPVLKLACAEPFRKMTKKERLYAHHMSRASWLGSKICLVQTSPEAPLIFDMFQFLFSERTYDVVTHEPEEELNHFWNYAVSFYGNLGNYLSFGDRKFVPRIPESTFETILLKHAEKLKSSAKRQMVSKLWAQCKEGIFTLDSKTKMLGKPHEATSGYYIGPVLPEDVELITRFMQEKKLEAWNSRLVKEEDGTLEIRFAAVEKNDEPVKVDSFEFEGKQVRVRYGDYGDLLAPVVHHLTEAKKHAANPTQVEMLKCYIEHFATGELQKHKDSQIAWVKDVGPAVETNLGFIENYRDGYGERSEFEGLVSVVNRDQSKKFDSLVSSAESLLPKLPWGKAFEKDKFNRPDFTALEVITFACSGIPVGINIPNYDDIRQTMGFKNVHLHNVLVSRFGDSAAIPFIKAEEQESFKSLRSHAFEVQVGLHELLGHGSGKIFSKDDVDKGIDDPLSPGKKITKYYAEGQTWSSVFKTLASSFEEARAEAVGIYLCLEKSALEIFGYTTEAEQAEIIYCNWLNMVHAGLVGLEFYSPERGAWGQAHMHARFAILNVLLRAGEGVVTLDVDEANSNMTISLDRSKIPTIGKKAVGEFLLKLQVYKSSADVEAGQAYFDDLTKVDDRWLKLRDIVIKHKKARPVYVQAHTTEEGSTVRCVEFTPSVKGMFLSMQLHFGEPKLEKEKGGRARKEKAPNGSSVPPASPPLQKAAFDFVDKVEPEQTGLNLRLKVVSVPKETDAAGHLHELIVGDKSGIITLLLRNPSAEVKQALSTTGVPLTVRNGRITMQKGHMRLEVDKWGKLIPGADGAESAFSFQPNVSNDMSATEYELVQK